MMSIILQQSTMFEHASLSYCTRQKVFPHLALKAHQSIMCLWVQIPAFSRSSWIPTTPTGRSTTRRSWPWAANWTPQLRNGPITCWPATSCSTVAVQMERISTIWTAVQHFNSQVDYTPFFSILLSCLFFPNISLVKCTNHSHSSFQASFLIYLFTCKVRL